MKRLIWVVLLPFIVNSSCDKKTFEEDVQKPSSSSLKNSDLFGVWTDPSNKLYYITFYPDGSFTYCFNDKMVGTGNYSLENDSVILSNTFTYNTDNLKIAINSNKMTLSGNVMDFRRNIKTINISYVYSSTEDYSPSIAGISKSASGGLNAYYSNCTEKIEFISDKNFIYEYSGKSKKTGRYETIKQHMWRYVYRKPYTYGLKLNDICESVEIYDFPFVYTKDYGLLDLDLNQFRIQ